MSTETTHINTDKQQDRTERSRRVPALRFKEFEAKWEKLKLRDVSSYFNGGSFENDVKDEGKYELITLKSVDMGGNLDHSNRFLDICVPTLKKGTLVMILSEQSPGLLGMTALIPSDDKYVLNQRVAEIRPNQKVESYFLSMAINRNQRFFSKYGAGTKVQNISKPNVENYSFLCPNLPEQQKIASFLSAVDEKIQQLTRKKELLEQYKKGVMQQLFSGKLRFKDENGKAFPKWEYKNLGSFADVSKLAGYEFTKHIIYQDQGNVIALRALNIKNNSLDLTDVKYIDNSELSMLKRSKLFIDDLMFTYIGTIGEVALIKENNRFYLAPNVARIRLDKEKVVAEYICQYFNLSTFKNKEIKKHIATGSQPSLTMENVRKFQIQIPCYQEQKKIANYLSNIDNKIESVNNQITQTQTFKKGLLQQMFV